MEIIFIINTWILLDPFFSSVAFLEDFFFKFYVFYTC